VFTFSGLQEIKDGFEHDGVRVVKDGFVSFGVVDLGEGGVALIDAGNDASGKAGDGSKRLIELSVRA
jgi:hypothetical protein